jgi:hypothetical protein
MCPLLVLPLPRVFLQRPLSVLTRQTRQVVRAINQSIFLRCLMEHTAFLVVNASSVSGFCKMLAVKAGTSIHLAHLPRQPAALFVPATIALILLKWIFMNEYALSNLLFSDIYACHDYTTLALTTESRKTNFLLILAVSSVTILAI